MCTYNISLLLICENHFFFLYALDCSRSTTATYEYMNKINIKNEQDIKNSYFIIAYRQAKLEFVFYVKSL